MVDTCENMRYNTKIKAIESELKLHRWMLGMLIAGVGSLVFKAFFAS